DLLDPAPVRLDILSRDPPGSHQNFEPARAAPLGPCLAAAQEITFGQDSYHLAFIVQYREAADAVLQHQLNGLCDGATPSDSDDVAGHDIRGIHQAASRSSLEFACCRL